MRIIEILRSWFQTGEREHHRTEGDEEKAAEKKTEQPKVGEDEAAWNEKPKGS